MLGVEFLRLVFLGGCGSRGGQGGVFFGGGGANPLLVLICSLCCSVKVTRGVASILASLHAVGAWGFPFIDLAVDGFGVNRVITSVLVGR